LLCAAAACVLVAAGAISRFRTAGELAPPAGSILNDTGATVTVGPCRAPCTTMLARFELTPGKSVRTGPAQASERWLLLDAAGNRLGCLEVRSSAGPTTVRVSNAVSC
jgi:hypothetical protein